MSKFLGVPLYDNKIKIIIIIPSINIPIHSLVIGIVVKTTRILKRKVQIGSAISELGTKYMIKAAIITPTDYIVSPSM